MFVDDRRSNISNLGALRQLVNDEGLEVLIVRNRHMQQEVLGAAGDEHADGLWQTGGSLTETLNLTTRGWANSNSHHRLNPAPQLLQVHIQPGAGDDPPCHAGLPWLGCTVVAAGDEKVRRIRSKALGRQVVFIADMPLIAQQTRVYQEYLDQISTAASEAIDYAAISLVGPRKYVERLVRGLSLLS